MRKSRLIDNSISNPKGVQDMSCNWCGSADIGRIIPFDVRELIAGTEVSHCKPFFDIQLLPMVAPTFAKLYLFVQYFFVPHRLCCSGIDEIKTKNGPNKNRVLPYFTPYDLNQFFLTQEVARQRTMLKHLTSMGLPICVASSNSYSTNDPYNKDHLTILPLRAYQQIWWDFYRDPEVLRDDVKNNFLSDAYGDVCPRNAETDYILGRQFLPRYRQLTHHWISELYTQPGTLPTGISAGLELNDEGGVVTADDNFGGDSTAAQQLRRIEAIQRLTERMTLSGKREIDQIFAKYGVKPDFTRLKMCEYIGGSKVDIRTGTLISSADTAAQQGLPLGAKSGEGYAALANLDINYKAREAGYMIGVFSIIPEVHYPQGFNKMWYRNSPDDFFTKEYERVGLVSVPKKEIAVCFDDDAPAYKRNQDNHVFGFDLPYYEYKHGYDILAGDMATYHNENVEGDYTDAYMHSMALYINYPLNRELNADNLQINPADFNKLFYYGDGGLYSNTDDHFHVNIDKDIEHHSAASDDVPTMETTEDPHASRTPLPEDTVL